MPGWGKRKGMAFVRRVDGNAQPVLRALTSSTWAQLLKKETLVALFWGFL